MTRAGLDQPVREDLAETPKRAGDEITPVRFYFEPGHNRLATSAHKSLRERHDDLADVLPGRHQAKGCIDIARRESPEGQRTQSSFFNQPRDLGEHLAGERFVARKDSVHRDDVEGSVVS